jgi:hypothetical protein
MDRMIEAVVERVRPAADARRFISRLKLIRE